MNTVLLSLLFLLSAGAARSQWVSSPNVTSSGVIEFLFANNAIFLTTSSYEVLRSTDRGINWTGITIGSSSNDLRAITRTPSGRILCGSSAGLYRTMNNGVTWSKQTTPATGTIASLFSYGENVIMSSPGKFWYSSDEGTSWREGGTITNNGTLAFCMMDSARNLYMRVNSSNGLYRATPGNNWVQIPDFEGVQIRTAAVGADGTVYVGLANSVGVMRSTDNGASWAEVNNLQHFAYISKLAVDSKGSVFVATSGQSGSQLYQSKDKGARWFALPPFPDFSAPATIAVSPNDTIYAAGYGNNTNVVFSRTPTATVRSSGGQRGIASVVLGPGAKEYVFELEDSKEITFTIFDALGRVQWMSENRRYPMGRNAIALPEFAPGVYHLCVNGCPGPMAKIMVR